MQLEPICGSACAKWLVELSQKVQVQNDSLLFITKSASKMTKRMLHKIVSQYMLNAGIEKNSLGPEVLRKTAIYNMFRSGRTLEEIQAATGIKTLGQINKYKQQMNHCAEIDMIGV